MCDQAVLSMSLEELSPYTSFCQPLIFVPEWQYQNIYMLTSIHFNSDIIDMGLEVLS